MDLELKKRALHGSVRLRVPSHPDAPTLPGQRVARSRTAVRHLRVVGNETTQQPVRIQHARCGAEQEQDDEENPARSQPDIEPVADERAADHTYRDLDPGLRALAELRPPSRADFPPLFGRAHLAAKSLEAGVKLVETILV
jgi:hypothetical protein